MSSFVSGLIANTRECRGYRSPSTPERSLAATAPALRMTVVLAAMLVVVVFASVSSVAQNITGTVTNGTTGKPSAGDDVTLLSLSQGMQEVASTKSDAQGHFSFAAPAGTQRSAHGARHP